MPPIRRVTTGLNAHSQAAVIVDELLSVPAAGTASRLCIWAANRPPVVPNDGTAPAFAGPLLPQSGGLNILQLTLPSLFRRDPESLHRTPTVDCVLQLSGQSVFVLSDREVTLRTGDWLVCNGILHDWRNDSEAESTLLAIVYGAVEASEG